MKDNGAQYIKSIFKYNAFTLQKNTAGITHEESIISPSNDLNPINWILGHVLVTRDVFLSYFGQEPLCSAEIKNTYQRGGNAAAHAADHWLDFQELLNLFEQSQLILQRNIEQATPEQLEKLAGFAFHESYHMGQFGILRKLLGKKGALA